MQSVRFPVRLRRVFGVALTFLLLSNAAPHAAFSKEPVRLPARSASARPQPLAAALADTHFVREVHLAAKDLVFNRDTGKFYASVPSRFGGTGNSIATVDATTGAVESYTFVGSEPGKLAAADDGRTLYVSLDGAGAVRRFDMTTRAAGAQFSLGESLSNGPFFVKDMAVAPGSPDLVAVSRKNLTGSPDFEGVAVYDGGARRTQTTPRHTGSDNIAFSGSASTLYGFREFGGIEKLGVTPAGVTLVKHTSVNTSGGDFKLDGGDIYLPNGQVYNAESGALLGAFTLPFVSFRAVEPDSSVGRVYFLTGDGAFSDGEVRTLTLHAFDRGNFASVGTLQIPNVVGRVSSLVRWGANGLAFGSTGGQLFIIQTTLVPSNQSVPTPTPTPAATPTPAPSPSPTPVAQTELPVVANDIVLDAASQTAFASVPSSAGAGGNSITPFDPFSGAVGIPVNVGSEPNRMAVSDNGQYIYVGLDGANAVRRFGVAARTPGLQFSLGNDTFGQPLKAVDLAVAPGVPQTVAVARGGGGTSGGGVAVYDDGVLRPNTTGVFHTINVIEYSASPLVLYGHNNSDSEGGFRKMAVPACGPSVVTVKGSLLWGQDFKIENGLAYSDSGRVADPEDGTLVGSYPVRDGVGDSMYNAGVVVDSKAGRVYFFLHEPVHSGTAPLPMLVRAYDLRTFLHVGSMTVPNISGFPTRVFRWGTDGFAVRTTANKVYLLRTDLVPAATQAVTPAPSPTPPAYTLRGQVVSSIFNGPQPAAVTLSVSGGGQTGTTTSNPDGTFAFNGLPFCTDFTVTPQPLENYTITPSSQTITAANQNSPNFANAFFTALPKLVSFAQTGVSVSEGGGGVTIDVTRTGDTSAPATVYYQTNDNTASERADYTAALGTISFAANETTKQVKVFVTDDARAETAESFTISLSDPGGALLGTFQMLTVTINDNDASDGTTNPADDPSFFVRQNYLDFLNREPDPEGLTFWTNEITACGANQQCREVKRINVSAAFFLSIEFQETGYLAYRAHKAAYGDATSPNVAGTVPVIRLREFLADARRIGQGVQVGIGNWQQALEANKAAYALEFVRRQRFKDAYPSNMSAEAFVERLDERAGRVLSAEERTQLVSSMGATPGDAAKRAAILRAVAEDADLRRAELNRAFVLMQFYGYLRRNPDDPQDADFRGWKFWLDKLNQFNGNYVAAEMVKGFISSDEYRKRFGQ
jgi:hypothetical protein